MTGKNQTILAIEGTIQVTHPDKTTETGTASITGSTNQPTMSDKQMEEMKCALLKILSQTISVPKGPIDASSNPNKDTNLRDFLNFSFAMIFSEVIMPAYNAD
jgi:hypothetical protein